MSANSILIDRLPVSILGAPINSDFKSILKFFELQDGDDEDRAEKICAVLFPEGAPDTPLLRDELKAFITMGEECGDEGEKIFDFRIDASRIFASFYQAYRIDLSRESLHWWAFLSLFSALPDDTIIRKVMEIRARKIDPKSSPKERTELIKMKERYSLNKSGGGDDIGLGVLFRRK